MAVCFCKIEVGPSEAKQSTTQQQTTKQQTKQIKEAPSEHVSYTSRARLVMAFMAIDGEEVMTAAQLAEPRLSGWVPLPVQGENKRKTASLGIGVD